MGRFGVVAGRVTGCWQLCAAVGLITVVVMAGLAGTAGAHISATWSAPAAVDHNSGPTVDGIACPSASQCTGVDTKGQEVTFDPATPGTPMPVKVDSAAYAYLAGISCFSGTQCTAFDGSYNGAAVVSFNPTDPGKPTTFRVEGSTVNAYLTGISCPVADQCTAVDSGGGEVTFDPGSPGTPNRAVLNDPDGFTSVSCPSANQCTGAGYGDEVTFDPQATNPAIGDTADDVVNADLSAVSCPSLTQCTATESVVSPEYAVTFNPQSPATPTAPTLLQIDSSADIYGLSCASTTQCTSVDGHGDESSFNPQSTTAPTPVDVDSGRWMYGVACPPSVDSCVAVDLVGNEITFDRGTPGTPTPALVDSGNVMTGVGCPSSTQCTATDENGQEVTFNQTAPGSPTPKLLDNIGGFNALYLACPSTGKCTAVDEDGNAFDFTPSSPGSPSAVSIDSGDQIVQGIACPSGTQCTAVGITDGGTSYADTFTPGSTPAPADTEGVSGEGVSCVSGTQCTTTEGYTYNPTTSTLTTTIPDFDGTNLVNAVSCPTAIQCTAVDSAGQELTFNPTSTATPTPVDIDGQTRLAGIDCPASNGCIAVDSDGNAVAFDPDDPSATTITDIDDTALDTISCFGATQCTVVDQDGNAILAAVTITQTPAVTLTSPANGSSTNNAEPAFSGAAGTATGDIPTITVKIYAGSTATGTPVQTLTTTASSGAWSVPASAALADGTYTAQASQPSSSEPTGTSGAVTFTVDTAAPVVTLTSPASGASTSNGEPTFSGAAGTASGDLPAITVKIYAGSTATGTPVQTLSATASAGAWSVAASPALPARAYAVQAAQSDAAGNVGKSATVAFTVTAAGSGSGPGSGTGGGGTGGGGSASTLTAPVNTAAPAIAGTALPGGSLSCSQGSWTQSPTKFAYQWLRSGAPIAGAISSGYTVQITDEAQTLGCRVTASNAVGSASATSAGEIVTSGGSATLKCPKPSGQLSGAALGPLKLGMTQKQARKKLSNVTITHNGFDVFCLYAGWGIRAAVPSQALLKTLPARQRGALSGRIVVMLTANPHYSAHGIAPGATQAAAVKALKLGKPIKVGANTWYLKHAAAGSLLLKMQKGIVQEIGVANAKLTAGTAADKRFLRTFGAG
jgi:hypothetical protein